MLKWRGYPDSDNTWEPLDNCNCPELIKEFEDKRNARKQKDTKELKKEKDREAKARKSEKEGNEKSEETVSSTQKLFAHFLILCVCVTVRSALSFKKWR